MNDVTMIRGAVKFTVLGRAQDEWISMMLKDREMEFTELRPIKLCTGTLQVHPLCYN